MDSDIKGDGVYHVTYASSEMPTFTTSQYSGDIQGYFTQELDWQNGAIDTPRSMYSLAPRPEMPPQIQYYSTYQPTTHSELYPSQVLWTGATTNGTSIAHGAPRRESRGGSNTNGRPKRRRTQSVVQRRAANVRERRRMFQLNEAFDVLRKRLPAFNYEKRLSRIETLRLAMTYISFMQDVTTGTDPKHVKLLSYQSDDSIQKYEEVQSNGYDSASMHEQADMVGLEEHNTELPSLIEASHHSMVQSSAIQPVTPEPADMSVHVVPEPEDVIQSSAVHVEMLPSVPPIITLPVTNHVILTEEEIRVIKQDEQGGEKEEIVQEVNETDQATQHLEKQCPSD